jgi:hypothetical protein
MMEGRKALLVFAVFVLSSLSASATNITVALASIAGNYSIVWAYNASDTSDTWKCYMPDYPSLSDLSAIFPNYGYWVRINSSNETLQVTGTVPSSTSTAMVSGWNLVGYPSVTAQNITTALSTISSNYSIVWAYNASDTSDTWKSYMPDYPSLSDLQYMNPGFGYWIRLNTTTETLII